MSSRDWFADAFGAAVSDIRAKLIDEAFFDRKSAEPKAHHNLGWSRDDHPKAPAPEQSPNLERGIDR